MKFHNFLSIVSIALIVYVLTGCEKEITVDLPTIPRQIVVEGSIEQNQPPIVLLSWSQGYFDPIDLAALASNFIRDARVYVSNGNVEVELDEICTSNLPEELLPLVSELTGLNAEQLAAIDLCIYTSFNQAIWGESNRSYALRVEYEDKILTSLTKINTPIALDSVWFDIPGNPAPDDSLGFAYARLTDPDTLGNAYRWFARRINRYPSWSQNAGEVKDQQFIAPLGSASDDAFFNGLNFEFAYFRGAPANSSKEDDRNEERGFFKVGDTIAIRGTVIDRAALRYIVTFEDQVASSGSPFASPANIPTNINGGLGAWIGYGAIYDTIICVQP
jgi:hypothetical protein